MSFFPGKDPQAGDAYTCDALAHVVVPRTVDLGDGFSGAIFNFLEQKAGIRISYAITEIRAVNPAAEMDRKALEVLGNEIILLKQLHFDEADKPIFYSLDYLKSNVFKLVIKRE